MQVNIKRNTEDFGPLAPLIGTWYGESGVDVSPEKAGNGENTYFETLVFEAVEDVDNAEEQALVVLRYLQTIVRKRDTKMIHNETGYYTWEPANNTIIKSFAIPRGVTVIAGGTIDYPVESQNNRTAQESPHQSLTMQLMANHDSRQWPIAQAPFMQQKASTNHYDFKMRLDGKTLSYEQTMIIEIYGRQVEHTDSNQLSRVNP